MGGWMEGWTEERWTDRCVVGYREDGFREMTDGSEPSERAVGRRWMCADPGEAGEWMSTGWPCAAPSCSKHRPGLFKAKILCLPHSPTKSAFVTE